VKAPDVSLDRFSVVGSFDHQRGDWRETAGELDVLSAGKSSTRALSGRRVRTTYSLPDGSHVSWAFLNIDGRSVPEDGELRVELNPNRTDGRALEVVGRMTDQHVTRADVAIDYEGETPGEWQFFKARSKSMRVQGTDRAVETYQLGMRGSKLHFVAYDKARELGLLDEKLMRIEARARREKAELPRDLFKGLVVTPTEIPAGLDVRTKANLALAIHYPESVGELDKRAQGKVRELLQTVLVPLDPAPADVYLDAWPRLVQDLHGLMCGVQPQVAAVYCRSAAHDEA
jgi:Putative phage replication protein RstA